MTFIPVAAQQVVEHNGVIILNDYPDQNAIGGQRPIARVHEGILEQGLHMAGLTKSDVAIVNLVPDRTSLAGLWNEKRRHFLPPADIYLDSIKANLESMQPKVVVTLGAATTAALLNRSDYTSIRGYPFELDNYIVVPTMHPRDMIWGNYIWRFYFSIDLKRAHQFARGEKKVVRPTLRVPESFQDAIDMLKSVMEKKRVSFDIEVSNYEVSCIGFSYSPDYGISIPFDQRWSEEEEAYLWNMVALILESPKITKIAQNTIFDVYFLMYKMHIFTKNIEDTMIAHHIAYPDFLKGLEFLGSVYTTLPYWKDEVDFKALKKEA